MESKERYLGIDLLRVISMMGILVLHFNSSGILSSVSVGSSQYWVAWILEILALSSVNVFAMISGYCSYNKIEVKSYRLFELLYITLFYCLLITITAMILDRSIFCSNKDIVTSIFPALKGGLWYITCFIPLFFTTPFINRLLNSLSLLQEIRVLIFFTTLLGIVSSITSIDLFGVKDGYSFLWLAICMSIGHCIRRTQKDLGRAKSIALIMGGVLLELCIKVIILIVLHKDSWYMIGYTSPFVLMESIGIFFLFYNIKTSSDRLRKTLTFFSSFSFDVYILHCHPVVYDNLIFGKFNGYASTVPSLLFSGIIFVVGVYFFLTIIGFIRDELFRLLHVQSRVLNVSKKIDLFFNMDFVKNDILS